MRNIKELNAITDMVYSNAMDHQEDPDSDRYDCSFKDELEIQITSLDEYCNDKDNYNITDEEAEYIYDKVMGFYLAA